MSMTKLICSDSFDHTVDIGMRIIEDPAQLTKQASTIFGCDYEQLAPDADHVGIHLTAVGATERYGFNRNADGWTKDACRRLHDTFVKHGHVYRHHRNKDPKKALGSIKASAYNEDMDRIELFIHAHKEKARDELERLEKDGEIPFSMAMRVPGDRCSICSNFRKNAEDPNQCEHVRDHLGELMEDGEKVGTWNDNGTFFDISFVGRPAERIAWNLKVAAGEFVDSIKLASASGIWVPDSVAIESAQGLRKLALMRKIAEFESWYRNVTIKTAADRYFNELRKAVVTLDDSTVEELRRYEPQAVFNGLAKVGAVMDAPSFFKYAFGIRYGEIAPYAQSAIRATRSVFTDCVKSGECQAVCNDTTFDADASMWDRPGHVPAAVLEKVAAFTLIGPARDERIIVRTMNQENVKFAVDTNRELAFNTESVEGVLAVKYAAYKLSAVAAILEAHPDTCDNDSMCAMMAAQNLAG